MSQDYNDDFHYYYYGDVSTQILINSLTGVVNSMGTSLFFWARTALLGLNFKKYESRNLGHPLH